MILIYYTLLYKCIYTFVKLYVVLFERHSYGKAGRKRGIKGRRKERGDRQKCLAPAGLVSQLAALAKAGPGGL